jgi:glycerate dehydrogenase
LRAVFLDFGTVSHDDLDTTALERVLPGITLYPTSSDAQVDERIASCEFILTNKLQITRARMRAAPGLRFVGLTATGTNNVDLDAARELGVAVCNIRDYCTVSVAQHALGVMLALTHRLREYGVAAIDGTWARC